MLRLFPGEAAAEDAPAAAQLYRHQVVVGLCEAGAGEANQYAALFDPGVETLAISGDSVPTSAITIIAVSGRGIG